MKNAAGDKGCDVYLRAELEAAGIKVVPYRALKEYEPRHSEVPADVIGELNGWKFVRAWYYWVARGPAIPFELAGPLHETHGQEVRVAGHCGCPSPREWYGESNPDGVPDYHVDSQAGLNALAAVIQQL